MAPCGTTPLFNSRGASSADGRASPKDEAPRRLRVLSDPAVGERYPPRCSAQQHVPRGRREERDRSRVDEQARRMAMYEHDSGDQAGTAQQPCNQGSYGAMPPPVVPQAPVGNRQRAEHHRPEDGVLPQPAQAKRTKNSNDDGRAHAAEGRERGPECPCTVCPPEGGGLLRVRGHRFIGKQVSGVSCSTKRRRGIRISSSSTLPRRRAGSVDTAHFRTSRTRSSHQGSV